MPIVRLTQPHTHAGVLHHAGEPLEVDANAAQWLVDLHIAVPVEPVARQPAKTRPSLTTPTKE